MLPTGHKKMIPRQAIRFYDEGTVSGSIMGSSRYHENDGELVCVVDEWAKPIGAALAFLAGALATGWAQSRIGSAGAGTIAEKPEMAGIVIIIEAIPETMTILGFVLAAIIMLL